MQQLTEENQQLNNKIIRLQDQQERLYQDLSKKIENLNSNLNKKKIINQTLREKELINNNSEAAEIKDNDI